MVCTIIEEALDDRIGAVLVELHVLHRFQEAGPHRRERVVGRQIQRVAADVRGGVG